MKAIAIKTMKFVVLDKERGRVRGRSILASQPNTSPLPNTAEKPMKVMKAMKEKYWRQVRGRGILASQPIRSSGMDRAGFHKLGCVLFELCDSAEGFQYRLVC